MHTLPLDNTGVCFAVAAVKEVHKSTADAGGSAASETGTVRTGAVHSKHARTLMRHSSCTTRPLCGSVSFILGCLLFACTS